MTDLVKPTLTFMASLGECAALMSKEDIESACRIVDGSGCRPTMTGRRTGTP